MARWFFILFAAISLSASPLLAEHASPTSNHADHGVAIDHSHHSSGVVDCCDDCDGDCPQACASSTSSANVSAQNQLTATSPVVWNGTAVSQITAIRPESTDPPPRV